MTVRLRMQRLGKPKRPFYRLVAIDQRTKRNGKPIEVLGQYDPMADKEHKLSNIKEERMAYWLKQGAQASKTVSLLLKSAASLSTLENK